MAAETTAGDYSVCEIADAPDIFEGKYPGEMRMLTGPLAAEQVAVTYRRMPPGSGGKGSYGHRHKTQEEIYLVLSGRLEFKLDDEVVELDPLTAVRVAPHTVRSVWNDGARGSRAHDHIRSGSRTSGATSSWWRTSGRGRERALRRDGGGGLCTKPSSAGDFTALDDLYADDALLDASVAGGRSRVAGPERTTALLASLFPGPGRLVEWSPRTYPEGIALWFERVSDDGTPVRQRHYLHLREGRIERHWAYTAPPRTPAGGARDDHGVLLDTRLVSGSARSRSTSRWSRPGGPETCSSASCSPTAGV